MMPPILIIPGLNGSGPHHWQTRLEQSFPGARREDALVMRRALYPVSRAIPDTISEC